MKQFLVFLLWMLLIEQSSGQFIVTGKVVDVETAKEMPLVQVAVAESNKGTVTDSQGNFTLKLSSPKGMLQFYFVGYTKKQISYRANKDSLDLGTVLLTPLAYSIDEVTISAGLAQKADPISISEISAKTIKQQLGAKPLPLIFNSTPGIFSVTHGGGTGDASMTIRGFKQENIGVLVNGVPVNGVENGLLYWSNWQGLSDASASIQIQKGPGVANMAANAVGGSVNIITSTPKKAKGGMISWQITSYNNQKISLALNSGKLNNGWNISLLGSYETGPGYIDATYVNSWAYYFTATKQINKRNKLNITLLGSPQRHGQRTLRLFKTEVDKYGYRYNKDWGGFNGKQRNASQNFYHKPFLSINHYFTIDDKRQWANTLYFSYGTGGGLWSESFNYAPSIFSYRDDAGQIDWQAIYSNNANHGGKYVLENGDTVTGYSMNVQTGFLASHIEAGWMSTYKQQLGKGFTFVSGVHYRYFNSFLREEIFDLLGGNFFIENYAWSVSGVADRSQIKMPGDIIRVDNNSIVNYASAYAQLLYSGSKLNGYFSLNGNSSFYQRMDRFNYIENTKSDLITKPGFDVRTGLAYKIASGQKLYTNAAYLNKAPYFKFVFGNFTNVPVSNLSNEQVTTIETGYVLNKGRWYASAGAYYTLWKNVSMLSNEYIQLEDNKQTRAMVNGLDAIHKGIEFSISYHLKNRLHFNVFGMLADYRWQNDVQATLINNNNVVVDTVHVYASGLYVGGTAQKQFGASVKFPLFNIINLEAQWVWFGHLYADFDPVNRTNANDRKQPYQFPSYNVLNMYLNVPVNLGKNHGALDIGFNNILNEHYITTGQDGLDHTANTFTGFWSYGFTFNAKLSLYF